MSAESAVATTPAEKSDRAGVINVDVRLCKDCRSTLFDRRDFEAELLRKPPAVRAYENLTQFERGIRLLLPKFQKLLTTLQYVHYSSLRWSSKGVINFCGQRSSTTALISTNRGGFQGP